MATTGGLSYSERAQSSKARGINENKKFTGFLGGIEQGLADDARCELFVSQLRAAATANKNNKNPQAPYSPGLGSASRRTPISPTEAVTEIGLGDVAFRTMLDWMRLGNEMYDDWLTFFCQLANRLNWKNVADITGSLDFIRGIKDITDVGERMFAVAVVIVFLRELKNDKTSVLNDSTLWSTATAGSYYSKDEILANLFTNKKEFTTSTNLSLSQSDKGPIREFAQAVKHTSCPVLTTPRVFNKYNYEKYCKKLLDNTMAEVRAEVDRVIAPETHTKELDASSIPILKTIAGTQPISTSPSEKYRYIRKEDKKLYIITIDGKETLATEFKSPGETTLKSTCTAAGFGFTDGAQCDEFFFSCITGRNLGGCSKFLSDREFWVKGKFEFLDNVNLYIAHIALKKYQIPIIVENGLKMYNFDGWAEVLDAQLTDKTSGLTAEAVKAIKENAPLMDLLKATTERINMFSAILNEDHITGPTEGMSSLAKPSSLTMFLTGRPKAFASQPPVSIPKGTLSELITGKVDQTKAIMKQILLYYHRMIPHLQSRMVGVPGVFPGVFGLHGLHGGADPVDPYKTWGIGSPAPSSSPITYGSNTGDSYDFYKDHVKTKELLNLLQGGLPSWLESTFNTRFAGLEANGHTMTDSDKKSILKVVEYVKNIEKILLMALHSFAKYGFFMDSELIPFLVSTYKGEDAKWTSEMNGLMKIHTKTVGNMIRIVELTEEKLTKYCDKVGKLGGVCDTLTTLNPSS